MKLTLDAIVQHCNSLAQEQQLREDARQLKARLLKLMADYEAGSIDQKTYAEHEAEIMAALSKLTQQVNSASSSGQNDPHSQSSFNTGLGF